MLALDTADDWTTVTLTFDDGAASGSWSPTATQNNAKDAFDALVTWFESTFAPKTAAWTFARDGTKAGAVVTLTLSSGFTVTANSAAQSLLGFDAASAGGQVTHTGTPIGTWIPSNPLTLRRYARGLIGTGNASGVGSVRPGVPGLAGRSPTLATVGSTLDGIRLVDSLAAGATSRGGWVYQTHQSAWRRLTLGAMRRQPTRGGKLYRISIEVAA